MAPRNDDSREYDSNARTSDRPREARPGFTEHTNEPGRSGATYDRDRDRESARAQDRRLEERRARIRGGRDELRFGETSPGDARGERRIERDWDDHDMDLDFGRATHRSHEDSIENYEHERQRRRHITADPSGYEREFDVGATSSSAARRRLHRSNRGNISAGEGPFRGLGPKNYRRSDESIVDDASRALGRDGDVDATEIDVECRDGVLKLRGKVEDRAMKRQAEDCVYDLDGVKDVRNELEVDEGFFSRFFGPS